MRRQPKATRRRTHRRVKPKKARVTRLERQYTEFFVPPTQMVLHMGESLEQPSALEVVPTVTTYGAYEEALLGG